MMCHLGAGIESTHGQKLTSWVGTLGWVAGKKREQRSFVSLGVFSVRAGLGDGGQSGILSLGRAWAGVPA